MPRLTFRSNPEPGTVVEMETTTGTYLSVSGLVHHNCSECARLHLMPDGITPRVWKVSEVTFGYHVKGENSPKFGGLHPNERCTPVGLSAGYGFQGGSLRWIAEAYDEWKKQRE